MSDQPLRIIENTSNEDLKKLWNYQEIVIPAKTRAEVPQGLAFFLQGKFPGKIVILPAEGPNPDNPAPKPPVRILTPTKAEPSEEAPLYVSDKNKEGEDVKKKIAKK